MKRCGAWLLTMFLTGAVQAQLQLLPDAPVPAVFGADDVQRAVAPDRRTEADGAVAAGWWDYFGGKPVCLVEQRAGLCGTKVENRGGEPFVKHDVT